MICEPDCAAFGRPASPCEDRCHWPAGHLGFYQFSHSHHDAGVEIDCPITRVRVLLGYWNIREVSSAGQSASMTRLRPRVRPAAFGLALDPGKLGACDHLRICGGAV